MRGPPEPSDECLLAAYCVGDVRAHEVLFRRYQEPLIRHLTRLLGGDRHTAEDLVVETFLRLHRHRHRAREGRPLRPWLYTIARNLARNRLRTARLWRLVPLTAITSQPALSPRRTPGIEARVTAAFAALPTPQREVCSLRLVAELPLDEIAQVTGASVGTVKSRLFYGLRRLRLLLADLASDIDEG